jgi:radical SAM superfamily enzyme YgiQ (UPF0313 family)
MNKKLDILFVHPNAAIEIYQKLAKDHSAIETPIWAAMLANHVRSRGHQTAIVDCEAEQYTVAEAQNVIKDFDAKIVCFVVYGQQPSASTQNMTGAVKLANAIKQNNPEQKILFVGPHVSALPQETLEKETSIDFVCQNEGVYAIDNLLNVENLDDDSQLSNVKGICFKTKDNFVVTNLPEAIVPKNRLEIDLPGLAWDLLPSIEKYRTAGWHSWSNNSDKSPFASIYTSLGCPYRCSFCMINIINRTKLGSDVTSQDSNIYRWWNPEFIIKQFDHIALMGVKNVKIADELFVLNPAHFMKICDLIIERKYDFNIWAYSRVDTCKPEYLDKLQNAGVKWLTLGIENPNNTLRKEIHKENFQEVKITNQIKTMRDAGINVGGNYIVGLPFDTLETMNQTLDFCFENMTEMVNIYTAMAYPGSPLYRDAKSRKKKLPETYSGYSQHSYDTINLSNDKLTAAEILKFRDDAWMK